MNNNIMEKFLNNGFYVYFIGKAINKHNSIKDNTEEKILKVGDIVEINDFTGIYSFYGDWFIDNNIPIEYCLRWKSGRATIPAFEYKYWAILHIAPHKTIEHANLALITPKDALKADFNLPIYLIDVKSLTKAN